MYFSQVVINEVHYNPSLDLGYEDSDYEFVELYNYTDHNIDITGWTFSSNEIHYQFGHHILDAGEYVLLCRNDYAYEGCINHHGGSLSNDSDHLSLTRPVWWWDETVDYVIYDDHFAPGSDAGGPSMELIDPSLAAGSDHSSDASDWQASSEINGTPGYQNSNGNEIEIAFIGFGSIGSESIEITMDTPFDVSGFQMDITGVFLGEASGGLAADAGFTVSTGSLSTIIGFSFTGGFIPAGSSGILTNVEYVAENEEACINNVILSDPNGNSLDVNVGNCISLELTTCDNPEACNFGSNGSCEYPEDNFDCDGNCIVEQDCTGECGGDAVVDECGICNGSGYAICWDESEVCDLSDCPELPSGNIAITYNSDSVILCLPTVDSPKYVRHTNMT